MGWGKNAVESVTGRLAKVRQACRRRPWFCTKCLVVAAIILYALAADNHGLLLAGILAMLGLPS